ncbi:hypothetical protein Axi01nite_04260 [Actinoplanes xinjiangensis]|nr:hypothetical protein Axi01nite_04260 [Actinoplanes xinjiangensis]
MARPMPRMLDPGRKPESAEPPAPGWATDGRRGWQAMTVQRFPRRHRTSRLKRPAEPAQAGPTADRKPADKRPADEKPPAAAVDTRRQT